MLDDLVADNSAPLLYESCDELEHKFLALKTQKDIAILLRVSYDRLVYHLYKVPNAEKYKSFSIQKKSGKPRKILSPSEPLKIIQRKLCQVLYSAYTPSSAVHGFSVGKSIVTNANQHVRKRFVLNVDLKDFFATIHFGRVRGIFMAPPYRLPERVATVLAQICCFDNQLPQGAPTSPIVSNMVCARLDSQLKRLAREMKCTYTRYADDLTFSTTLPKFPYDLAHVTSSVDGYKFKTDLGNRLVSVLSDNGFEINYEKVRLQHKNHHQEVTGITVNQFPNVKRSFIREISSMLYVWEKYGLAAAQEKYIKKQMKDLKTPAIGVALLDDVVRGKINFLGMVRGKENKIYLKYLNWYQNLTVDES